METTLKRSAKPGRRRKSGHVRIQVLPIDSIRPSPENERLYRPVDPTDPEIVALSESIGTHGVQEALTVTRDGWIVSGHRRYCAAKLAGLTEIPCRVLRFAKDENHDRFMALLRECNLQRTKSFDEKLREEALAANPEAAYEALLAHRKAQAGGDLDTLEMQLRGRKHRSEISEAKRPFLEAVLQVLRERRRYWPLSDRQIHYALLNAPPLIHASKPGSRYQNTLKSYRSLVDLLTRARLQELVPMEAIADPTRPVSVWAVHRDVQTFIRKELDGFGKNYWRDLTQSQPDHIEIVCEKNTVEPIIRPVAAGFTIPLTSGRGFCSLPPRWEIAERYCRSGKDRLILLILSDFDPDGQEIAHSPARSLRDDFGIRAVVPIKVALTAAQVEEFHLPPIMQAKRTSTNYQKFAAEYGDAVFELEAIAPDALQRVLTEAIDAVIDEEMLNREIDQERQDAADLETTRRKVHRLLGGFPQNPADTEGQA